MFKSTTGTTTLPFHATGFAAILVALAFALSACGDGGANEHCTEGRSLACSCLDGQTGAQVCQDDGTWSACSCELSEADAENNNDTDHSTGDAGTDEDAVGEGDGGGQSDTGDDSSDTGNLDDRGWYTPYPDPPSNAKFVTPDDIRSVLSNLQPGDTMVLRDGTYPLIELSDMHGTADNPITIMAENERKALVRGDGYEAALRIRNSSHLAIKGIHFENIDVEASNSEVFGAMAVYITGSEYITLWRNIMRKPNTWGNNTAVKLSSGTSNCLLEENEVLDFHRNGISFFNGSGETSTRNNVMRRNYINPGDTSRNGTRWGPNYGIATYRGVNSIVENNILDYSQENGEERRLAQNCGANNRFYGNIVINGKSGFANFHYDTPMKDGVLENNLVLDSSAYGTYIHSVDGFVARNNTFVNPAKDGYLITDSRNKNPSFTGVNNLVVSAGDHGYTVSSASAFTSIDMEYSSGWNNDSGTWGGGTSSRDNVVPDQEPNFAGTYVYIPEDSPYHGAGKDGADVGANILYRYENGTLTDKPLWHPETGEFPHGAIIPGVNDRAGHSASDIHERLDVSASTLPADY